MRIIGTLVFRKTKVSLTILGVRMENWRGGVKIYKFWGEGKPGRCVAL